MERRQRVATMDDRVLLNAENAMEHATVYVQTCASLSFIVCIGANGKGEQGFLRTKRVSLRASSAKQESRSSDDVCVIDVWGSMVNEFSISDKLRLVSAQIGAETCARHCLVYNQQKITTLVKVRV